MTPPLETTTTVGIVGAGPAGLMLSHLLARGGIDSVVIDHRTRREIEETVRAGILEHDSVRLLLDSGVSERVLSEGYEHTGIELRFDGVGHRIDFRALVGESVWLYPQTDVFIDLAAARDRDGGDVRYGISDAGVHRIESSEPVISYRDTHGRPATIRCAYLVGADGSHSMCRHAIPPEHLRQYRREYPFAWFGILTEAPPSAPELIYAHSQQGFALISQRTETLQRMYFQCDPDEDVEPWTDERIWDELQARVDGGGFELKRGPITSKGVLRFRSSVVEPMRHGRLLLAGDAAHTVPPTGAKGLNLALADVRVLAEVLEHAVRSGDDAVLQEYSTRALERVWRAQNFSYWMTSMLHLHPDAEEFDVKRQLGELTSVVSSRAGSTYLAEGYTGWPGGI